MIFSEQSFKNLEINEKNTNNKKEKQPTPF